MKAVVVLIVIVGVIIFLVVRGIMKKNKSKDLSINKGGGHKTGSNKEDRKKE